MSKNNRSTRAVQKLRNQLAQAHTALVAERKLNDRLDAEAEALTIENEQLLCRVQDLAERLDAVYDRETCSLFFEETPTCPVEGVQEHVSPQPYGRHAVAIIGMAVGVTLVLLGIALEVLL